MIRSCIVALSLITAFGLPAAQPTLRAADAEHRVGEKYGPYKTWEQAQAVADRLEAQGRRTSVSGGHGNPYFVYVLN